MLCEKLIGVFRESDIYCHQESKTFFEMCMSSRLRACFRLFFCEGPECHFRAKMTFDYGISGSCYQRVSQISRSIKVASCGEHVLICFSRFRLWSSSDSAHKFARCAIVVSKLRKFIRSWNSALLYFAPLRMGISKDTSKCQKTHHHFVQRSSHGALLVFSLNACIIHCLMLSNVPNTASELS